MNLVWMLYLLYLALAIVLIRKLVIRLQLSKAKHKSMRGHSKWSRRISKWISFFDYNEQQYFCVDGAPKEIAQQRKNAFTLLANTTKKQSNNTFEQYQKISNDVSDVQFTSLYRVPFPFRTQLPEIFKLGSMINQSQGVKVKDLDGQWRYDLSGSYGVNVFGYEFYKQCIEQGSQKVAELGPALGSYHPLISDNVKKIKAISKLDEVSFHMSGTEAVMQAVRMARYHTKKTHLVRLCGAYHGWWDGVQPGIGNRRNVDDVYTLAYRPHNNALMEYFTTNGRLRSNEYLIGRKDVKGLLKSLKDKKVCYYLPDQDYGRNRCEFVPFYAVPDAATTTGTLMFAASKHCETMSLISRRDDHGKYHLEIIPELKNFPSGDDRADVTCVNQRMERSINAAPEQYMWLHRRFKTRPDKNTPSFYKK